MTTLVNVHKMDKEFSVGDMVYLRLKGYRQKFVPSRETKKLTNRFYGPFKVLERIGKVAYYLALPPEAKIHSVFHVSLLRQAHENPTLIPLPEITSVATVQPKTSFNINMKEIRYKFWWNGTMQMYHSLHGSPLQIFVSVFQNFV